MPGSNVRAEDGSMTTMAKPHGFVTKGIHWLSAGLLGFSYLKGIDSVSQLADPAVLQLEVVLALLLGGLFVIRLIWTKLVAGSSRLPADAPGWEHTASRMVHHGLYASVFLIVLTGLGIALGVSTPVLGGLFLTAMIALHEFSLVLLPVLLAVHIAGAVWHKAMRRDGVMESMTGRLPI